MLRNGGSRTALEWKQDEHAPLLSVEVSSVKCTERQCSAVGGGGQRLDSKGPADPPLSLRSRVRLGEHNPQ